MAVEISGTYVGGLKVAVQHGPSGAVLHTAAPVDNQGDGSSFSPTDLTAAALGACMLTIMGIIAERNGVDLDGCRFQAEKHMQSDPRRIARVPITFHMPAGLDAATRKKLERGAMTCPVAHSLHPELDKDVRFSYSD
ncbi:MAG: OsmC family protein [Acidobacteriota bacterium]